MTPARPRDHDSPPTARLALATGDVFRGRPFGAVGQGLVSIGEVVFNTAMTGYQESLTDPSYAGQILVETTPLIGNTGVNEEDLEAAKVQVAGFVVHELARRHSNYRATRSLSEFLADSGILGIEGLDTRALTRVLRSGGVVQGVITDDDSISDEDLVARARGAASMEGQNLAALVGCSSEQSWSETLGDWAPPHEPGKPGPNGRPLRVIALDCGAKRNILRHLTDRGCEVRLVPHDISPSELRTIFERGEADGLFISNGPGDPAAVERTIDALRELLFDDGLDVPTFGICLGHQLLALAMGATTFKLPFGHRGANQPVLDTTTGRVQITSQNHGFAVDPASLEAGGAEATHTHLNDATLAGFRVRGRPIFAVQFHPEASPGPHDASPLFDRFVELMRAGSRAPKAATR
ncbi:MAG: glutamine-hydrolyzing carbamoyl-phosphate synthase small subunit [Phycisphaerales bacterium]